jgi:hypothetical protein
MHRTPPVFRDGDLEHQVRSQPTNGPQMPRQRAKSTASPLDCALPGEGMMTAVGLGDFLFAVPMDCRRDSLGKGPAPSRRGKPVNRSLRIILHHRSVIPSLQRAIPVMAER